jgi:hypothetical protein
MPTRERFIDQSDRLYQILLAFYPNRFRTNFGTEMSQIFRDCCVLETERGGIPALLYLWFRTVQDLVLSIAREWRREVTFIDSELDVTGLIDAFMVSMVVGTILLSWGWMGAVVALNLTVPQLMEYRNSAAFVLAGIVMLAVAALIGILSAMIVARSGRTKRTRINV